jgi:hypothetical protein
MELTESPPAGSFILSLANRNRSLENVTILSGQNLQAGAVLGKVASSGKYVAFDNDATDGSQTAAGILLAPCDASEGDKQAAIVAREAEVNEHELVWDEDNDTADIAAGLAELITLQIIPRG